MKHIFTYVYLPTGPPLVVNESLKDWLSWAKSFHLPVTSERAKESTYVIVIPTESKMFFT